MKIALIGSAPSSAGLAPYDDTSWRIWACSPASTQYITRCNAFFELHRFVLGGARHSHSYVAWLAMQGCPIYMIRPVKEIPGSVAYPRNDMVDAFGPFFFTSSIAWMFAFALSQEDVEEIGLWGVDMAGEDEYVMQRPGLHYFVMHAQARGVRVTVPPESDLLKPPPLYGYITETPRGIKWEARLKELQQEERRALEQMEDATRNLYFLRGALSDHRYHMLMEPGE